MEKTRGSQDLNAAFDVNVRGFYRLLNTANRAEVQRVVYASSLSVYRHCHKRGVYPLHEGIEVDAWDRYGMSKRIGEYMGEAWSQQRDGRTFVALRLMWPRNDADWPGNEYQRGRTTSLMPSGQRIGALDATGGAAWHPTGPNDIRRAFLAALSLDQPGAHAVQVTGDLEGEAFPFTRAEEVFGWRPQGDCGGMHKSSWLSRRTTSSRIAVMSGRRQPSASSEGDHI
jgi:nucleoside-diphosphate-sugar epimerase